MGTGRFDVAHHARATFAAFGHDICLVHIDQRDSSTAPRWWPEMTGVDLSLTHRVLLVSPHLDDTVLSCAAFLDGRSPLDMLTVFTGTPANGRESEWDRRCGFASAASAMQARRAEDHAALAGSPHRGHHLGLLDIGYLEGRPRAAADADRLLGWVRTWLDEDDGRPSLILLPVGSGRAGPLAPGSLSGRGRLFVARIARGVRSGLRPGRGNHGAAVNPDHAWVRDALAGPLAAAGTSFGFYEEHPYLLGHRGDSAAERLSRDLGLDLVMAELPLDRAAKVRRIAAYRSQLPQLLKLCPLLLTPERREPVERYWLPAGSAPAITAGA